MVKHSTYTTEANIARLIRQLVGEARKTKLLLECSFCFGRRSDGIVPTEPTNTVFSFPDYPEFSSSISHNTPAVKSLLLKDEKSKKAGRKTTTKKLLEEVAERAKMSRDLEKTQTALQIMWACKDSKCQYYRRYCYVHR